jgi:putative transcriptional regulator
VDSSLRERLERLGRVREFPRVESGSPDALRLEWAGKIQDIRTISAIFALSRRWMPMIRAKRAIETLVADRRIYVYVPKVESLGALVAELAEAGVKATSTTGTDPDVKATRERLGLTQEGFALRYGLDLDAVRNWEHGRRKPDTAARSFLRAISNDPHGVEVAVWTPREAAGRAAADGDD